MGEQINLKAAGLYLDANPLSEAPPGAMSEATDVVISRPGIVESRPGFNRLLDTAPMEEMTTYRGAIITYGVATIWHWTGSTWAVVGSANPPDQSSPKGVRVRFQEAARNLYLTSDAGIKRLDSLAGALAPAGAPKALDPTLAIANTSAGLWLTAAHQVAYYLTWSITDANGNMHEGAPSGRVLIDNTGATDATVNVTIPIISTEMTTAHVFKVYRTAIQSSGTDPGAEAQLVYQRSPTSAEVAAGTLTFEDVVPDALRGATAYFAPSQEGILSGNDAPPIARDLCLFRGTMFYAHTTGKQRLQLSLLAVGGTDGLQANGTVTINGVTYTAKASPSAATDFQITTSGTVSQNIEATARALVAAVNRYAAASGGTIGAYYLSGELDAPGKMLFEERGLGGAAFSATASAHAAAWSPQLPSSGTAVSSDADVKTNRLCWSKYQQPEAVPLLNFVDVGSGTAAILRILALRDSLIILKEDGVFRLTGDAGFFRVDLLDPTVVLAAPRTAKVANGRVFAWCTLGLMAISDTGAESLSFGRVDSLLSAVDVDGACAAVSEVTHRYMIVTRSTGSNWLLYSYFTDTWTSISLVGDGATIGCGVDADGHLYIGDDNEGVFYESDPDADAAYADSHPDGGSIVSVDSATTVTLSTVDLGVDGASISVGDLLWQANPGQSAPITAIDGNTLTVEEPAAAFDVGACNVLKPLSIAVKYLPATGGTANAKQFTDCALLFEGEPPSSITVTFATDLGASASVTLTPGLSSNPGELWTWVPPECQRCGRLTVRVTHQVAGERFRLLGISLKARGYGERRFGR